jgi:hypothetical protein
MGSVGNLLLCCGTLPPKSGLADLRSGPGHRRSCRRAIVGRADRGRQQATLNQLPPVSDPTSSEDLGVFSAHRLADAHDKVRTSGSKKISSNPGDPLFL